MGDPVSQQEKFDGPGSNMMPAETSANAMSVDGVGNEDSPSPRAVAPQRRRLTVPGKTVKDKQRKVLDC